MERWRGALEDLAVRVDESIYVSLGVNSFELTIGANGRIGEFISERYSPCYKFKIPAEAKCCADYLGSLSLNPRRLICAAGHPTKENYGLKEHNRELFVLQFMMELVAHLSCVEELILISSRLVEFSVKDTCLPRERRTLHENYRLKKLALEHYFIHYPEKFNPRIRRRIIRLSGVFGLRNDLHSRLVPSICLAGQTGKPLLLRSGILSKVNLVPIGGLLTSIDPIAKKSQPREDNARLVTTLECELDFTVLSVIWDFFVATGIRITIKSRSEHEQFERVLNDSEKLSYPLHLAHQHLRLFFEGVLSPRTPFDHRNKNL